MVETISVLNGQQNSPTFEEKEDRNSIGKDGFMRLLLTQLRNQDPQNPLKSHEFASQLAQFTQVEQLFNLNDKLDKSIQIDINLSQSIGNTLATTIVGKNMMAIGNEISLLDGKTSDIFLTLKESAPNVSINIFDSNGTLIKREKAGAFTTGDHTFSWDGKNDEGVLMPDGKYTFEVKALSNSGNTIPVAFFMGGHISGVEFSDDNPTTFLIGFLKISVSDVVRIVEAEGS